LDTCGEPNVIYQKNAITETIDKKKLRGRPRTRRKDGVENDIWTVDRNVSVELAFDMGNGEDCLR